MKASDLGKFLGGRQSGNTWAAKCPAHDDRLASLSIRDGDKLVLFTCHAGCSQQSITAALKQMGLELKQAEKYKLGPVVATYDYLDEDGRLLYQKTRHEPKDFRLRQPLPGGGWSPSIKGAQEVIYRLPDIRMAAFTGEPVYIVEGEKDADRLASLGLIATTNTHGASKDKDKKPKWTIHQSKFLKGISEAVILPDNDEPGRAHALAVASSLLELGIPSRIVELPGLAPKGDVSDFLAAGGTTDQILELAEKAAFFSHEEQPAAQPAIKTMTAASLMSVNFEAPRWAIEDLLPEGLTLLAGAPKLGKSWMALQIALAVSRGERVFGDFPTVRGEVLYLALEDSFRRLQQRISLLADDRVNDNENLILCTEIDGMAAGGVEGIEQFLIEHPDCRLIIIDTLAKFLPPADNKNSAYQNDYCNFGRLQKLALKYRVTILGVHHTRKSKSDDALDSVSGSSGVTGAADAIWILNRARTEAIGTLLVTGRDIDESNLSVEFDKDSATWTIKGDARQEQRRELLVKLSSAFQLSPFTYTSGAEALSVSVRHAKRLIGGLHDAGYLNRLPEKVGKCFQFQLTDKFISSVLKD